MKLNRHTRRAIAAKQEKRARLSYSGTLERRLHRSGAPGSGFTHLCVDRFTKGVLGLGMDEDTARADAIKDGADPGQLMVLPAEPGRCWAIHHGNAFQVKADHPLWGRTVPKEDAQ